MNVVRHQNAALVKKMSIPATSSNSAEAIKQALAATNSVVVEIFNESKESSLPTAEEQEIVESFNIFTALVSNNQDEANAEFVTLDDDGIEVIAEHILLQVIMKTISYSLNS